MLGVTILSDLNRPEQALWPYGPEWVQPVPFPPDLYLALLYAVMVGCYPLTPRESCLHYGVAPRDGTFVAIWRTFDGRLRGVAVRQLPDNTRTDSTPLGQQIVSDRAGLPPPLLAPAAAAPVDLLVAWELARRRPGDERRQGPRRELPDPTEQLGDPGPGLS